MAVFILIHSFNTLAGNNREQVQQELQKLLGKDVAFDRLEATLWGGIGFSAREFRIADDPRFAATPFLHAKELRLGVSLWQLLLGQVVINSLTFQAAEFQIITNEAGLLNTSALASRKQELNEFPKFRTPSPEKRRSAVSFMISKIRMMNGRLDFIDRSVKEPAELRVKNIELEAQGLESTGRTRIKFAAAVTEGLSRDIRIEGLLGPVHKDRDWPQQPIDLELQFDSLYLPSLARALPFLRNKIPRELNVTGPMSLQAKLTGTLQGPHVTDITLKVPLFGSSDYNAIIEGIVLFPENRNWTGVELKGTLKLDRINLLQLRALPFLQQFLPVALVTEGAASLSSRFEGNWDRLRIGALIQADNSDFRFGGWLRKPPGVSAKLRAQVSRQKNGFVLHESLLNLGNSRMVLSGVVDDSATPGFKLKLHGDRGELAAWSQLVSPLSFYRVDGKADWDILFEKTLAVIDDSWKVRGKLNLADTDLKHKNGDRKIDHLNATVAFLGTEARVENATFRLGSSNIVLAAGIADLAHPSVSYKLWSQELRLADLPAFPESKFITLKNVTSTGDIQVLDGLLLLTGTVASPDGNLKDIAFHDMRADLAWSSAGMQVKNLSLQALNGTVRSEGTWVAGDEASQRFELASRIDSVDVQSLLAQTLPQIQNRIAGQLDFRGKFNAASQNGKALQDVLKGSGEAFIQHGTIKDFNLMTQFFFRGNRASRSPQLPATLVALMNRRDTPFDVLKANFTVEQKRIRTDNLLLSTPEYTITGAGWAGFDRTIQWNGLLLLSPGVTQELQREHKTIRYFVDRRGRLAVSFRVEGTLPDVRIRPENRALAQAFRWGSSEGGNEAADLEKKDRRDWFRRPLDKLLNR